MRVSVAAIMVLLAVSVAGVNAFAQSGERSNGGRSGMPGGGWGDSSQFVDRIAEHLQLDETQRQSVQNIFDSAKPEMEALRESMQTRRETVRSLDADDPSRAAVLSDFAAQEGQMVTEGLLLRDRIQGEINAVLNDEQKAKFAEIRDHWGNRGGARQRAGRGERQGHDQDSDSETL